MTRHDRAEAAHALRKVLSAVDDGTLSAPGPAGARLVRRLEGAVIALDCQDPSGPRTAPAVAEPTSA